MAPPRGRPSKITRTQAAADAAQRNSLATVAQAQAAVREREQLRSGQPVSAPDPSQTPVPVPVPRPAQTTGPLQTTNIPQPHFAPIPAPGSAQLSLPPAPPFGVRHLAPSPVSGPGAAGTPPVIPPSYLNGGRPLTGPGGRPGTHGRPGAAHLAATAVDLTNEDDIANNVALINAVDSNPLLPPPPPPPGSGMVGPTATARTAFIRHGDLPVPPQGEFVAIFSSWEVLWHHVSTIATNQGYRVTKRRSSAYKQGKPGRFDLACDHGGTEYKSTAKERQATTRKTGCPWQARAICMRSMGGQWKFVVTCGSHNHPPVNQEAEKAKRQQSKKKLKEAPPLIPPVLPMTTGVTDSGQLRAESDPDAQGFMASVEEAQEKERQRVGLNISEQLYRIEQMMGVVTRVENAVLRMEHQFGHRLAAIEQRMAVIEKTWE